MLAKKADLEDGVMNSVRLISHTCAHYFRFDAMHKHAHSTRLGAMPTNAARLHVRVVIYAVGASSQYNIYCVKLNSIKRCAVREEAVCKIQYNQF